MALDEALIKIKGRIDHQINDLLCNTKPDYDDSLTGINEAWDIVRKILQEEIRNAQKTIRG
jgi:hypothetical protein